MTRTVERNNKKEITKTQIGSWVGKLVAHYPIARWLRSACAMLTRLTSIDTEDKDQLVSNKIVRICDKLENDIRIKGDPVKGKWKLNVDDEWTLYVDASRTAYGACLYIGEVRAEDASWIRPKNDHRHINIAELDSVLKGLTIVMQYRKVNKIKGKQHINIKTDNKSVAAWLSRKKSSHWIPVKGICRSAVESRLQYYDDTISYNEFDVDVQWIASAENLADELSRVPQYMIGKEDGQVIDAANQQSGISMQDKGKQVIVTAAHRNSPDPIHPGEPLDKRNWISRLQRNNGKVVVPEQDISKFMNTVHDHEGASALYNRLRTWTDISHLKQHCREVVNNCEACQKGKTFPGDRQAWHNTQGYVKCKVPFAKVYTDVVGPYQTSNGEPLLFAVTIVDGATGYALTRSTKHSPTSQDVVELFQHLTEVYGTSPLVVHTDNGSIFVSEKFSKYLRSILAVQERSAVHASWSNGKVERLHRDINAYIRCRSNTKTLTYKDFSSLIKEATIKHNVTPQRDGKSPHDKVFQFKALSEPYMPIELREGYEELLANMVDPSQLPETLQKGTRVLCRKHVQGPKHQPVWEEARILRRVASNMYEVAVPDQKGELYARVEHTKNMKKLPDENKNESVPETSDDNQSMIQLTTPASSSSKTVTDNLQEVQDFKNSSHPQQVQDDNPTRRSFNGFERRRSARLRALQEKKGGM